ncbi:MAG: hypothetical protein WD046_09780 [Paracoccaceae bacterium]
MEVVGTGLLGLLAVFQLALAAGAPWGVAAWGGQNPGRLPRHLRIASLVNIAVFLLAIWALLGALTPGWLLWSLTAFFGLGILMNLISRSRVERLLWTPVATGICAAFLLRALS